jgi:hypothetical protein
MIPNNSLSSIDLPAAIIGARQNNVGSIAFGNTFTDLVDYEDGGIYIGDSSEGLDYQVWTCETDGTNITISSSTTASTILYSGTNITLVSLAFDQNMQPNVSFVEDGTAKFRWYDSTISGYTIDIINGDFPRMFLDDKRSEFTASSDVLLAYTRVVNDAINLYFRMQRDRYGIEYLLKEGIDSNYKFTVLGMGSNLRLQFVFTPPCQDNCIMIDPYDYESLCTDPAYTT